MDQQKIDNFIMMNSKYFKQSDLIMIKINYNK